MGLEDMEQVVISAKANCEVCATPKQVEFEATHKLGDIWCSHCRKMTRFIVDKSTAKLIGKE